MLNVLQEEDYKLQEILPHYIQHYTTDGVEFDIYLGQALLEEKRFDSTHLSEFRYWQLKLMCKITYEAEKLKNSLPIPLTTAQLILWYSNPIDISFRPDEKKFDVKGSHSVQYEIIKKRIDKALVYGTKERLTSNGKIAIVYLKPEDKSEIRKVCLQLAEEGLIHHEIEELDLEDMKGIRGLKAIRVRKI